MSPDEEQIWRLIRHKDGRVFEEYYKMHYRFFFLSACKYLQDPGKAEEVVNDVFLRIWEDALTLDIKTSLKFYIHRAIVNHSLNELDKDKRERLRREQLKDVLSETEEWQEVEDTELKLRLYRTIDQLPEQCQKVFRLSRFQNMKQQEIADLLGISIKTVKNHITRAMKDLNKVLLEYRNLPLWIIAISHYFWYYH